MYHLTCAAVLQKVQNDEGLQCTYTKKAKERSRCRQEDPTANYLRHSCYVTWSGNIFWQSFWHDHIIPLISRLCLESTNLCQSVQSQPKLIRYSNSDYISARLLPKCFVFITLLASVILQSVIKIGWWLCEIC